jgi:mono/diheme cytochrome c family protein
MSFRTSALALIAATAVSACNPIANLTYREGRATATARYDLASLTPAQRGAVYFSAGDLKTLSTDTLNTGAVPWALAKASLTLDYISDEKAEVTEAAFRKAMRKFGFLFPDTIANWPAVLTTPEIDGPLGMAIGPVEGLGMRVTTANLTCAACHAGVTYNAEGIPQPGTAWLGSANTAIDLEAYTAALLRSFLRFGDKPDVLLAAAEKLSPGMSAAEKKTLRDKVLPRLMKRAKQLDQTTGRALPFDNGHAGTTNGIGAVKLRFGLLDGKTANSGEIGLVSIPVINAAFWRSSLLADNVYAYPGGARYRPIGEADITDAHLNGLAQITTLFLVGTAGVSHERSPKALPQVEDIYRYLRSTRAAPFPGQIDKALAARGADIYAANCASCHGQYEDGAAGPTLVRFPNWHGETSTDLMRAKSFDAPMAERIRQSNYGKLIDVQPSDNYSAPPLAGVWASAPYLHNGTVPSVWTLLTPSERPLKFVTGGHALDFTTLGIKLDKPAADGVSHYFVGYGAYSDVSTVDSTEPGYSNRGHTYGAALPPANKHALIEFLKQL